MDAYVARNTDWIASASAMSTVGQQLGVLNLPADEGFLTAMANSFTRYGDGQLSDADLLHNEALLKDGMPDVIADVKQTCPDISFSR